MRCVSERDRRNQRRLSEFFQRTVRLRWARMTALGHEAKNSQGAKLFRCTFISGSRRRSRTLPARANNRTHAPRSFVAGLGEVEGEHTFQMARPLKHLLMPQRAHRVVVSSAPVILHREPRELVVLRVALVMLRAVDEVHDVVELMVGGRARACPGNGRARRPIAAGCSR